MADMINAAREEGDPEHDDQQTSKVDATAKGSKLHSGKGKQPAADADIERAQAGANRIYNGQVAEVPGYSEKLIDGSDNAADGDRDPRSPTMDHQPELAGENASQSGTDLPRRAASKKKYRSGITKNKPYKDIDLISQAKRDAFIAEINRFWGNPARLWVQHLDPKREDRGRDENGRLIRVFSDLTPRDVSTTVLAAVAQLAKASPGKAQEAQKLMSKMHLERAGNNGQALRLRVDAVNAATAVFEKRARRKAACHNRTAPQAAVPTAESSKSAQPESSDDVEMEDASELVNTAETPRAATSIAERESEQQPSLPSPAATEEDSEVVFVSQAVKTVSDSVGRTVMSLEVPQNAGWFGDVSTDAENMFHLMRKKATEGQHNVHITFSVKPMAVV